MFAQFDQSSVRNQLIKFMSPAAFGLLESYKIWNFRFVTLYMIIRDI